MNRLLSSRGISPSDYATGSVNGPINGSVNGPVTGSVALPVAGSVDPSGTRIMGRRRGSASHNRKTSSKRFSSPFGHGDSAILKNLIEDAEKENMSFSEAWAARARATTVLLSDKMEKYHDVAKKVLMKDFIRNLLFPENWKWRED